MEVIISLGVELPSLILVYWTAENKGQKNKILLNYWFERVERVNKQDSRPVAKWIL